jgi:CRISPR-associated protein Cas5t
MDVIHMYVAVPVAGFRVAQAREFWETYPCPPPSTVYGMLLSLVGESNRLAHKGTEVAIGLIGNPERSVVLRTLWRVKNIKMGPGLGSNKRPDFQELLTNVQLSLWIRRGKDEKAQTPLQERLQAAFANPKTVSRFGGLSLGESTHFVNEIRFWRQDDLKNGRLLLTDEKGDLSLPIWPDHVGSKGTVWGQFSLREAILSEIEPPESAWITIHGLEV